MRAWFASPYWQSYLSPFDIAPSLAKNWTLIVTECKLDTSPTASPTASPTTSPTVTATANGGGGGNGGVKPSRPLGGEEQGVFSEGGYSFIRSPTLPENATDYATGSEGGGGGLHGNMPRIRRLAIR